MYWHESINVPVIQENACLHLLRHIGSFLHEATNVPVSYTQTDTTGIISHAKFKVWRVFFRRELSNHSSLPSINVYELRKPKESCKHTYLFAQFRGKGTP